uniref:Gamma-aminobutyric acid type A receptor subunit rho1 n=1 Tax=Sinocyclocheilus rhinocerous TaxID=307959 RepID=A0A673I0X8_9TELE
MREKGLWILLIQQNFISFSFCSSQITQRNDTSGWRSPQVCPIFRRSPDMTKSPMTKSEQLLRIDDHDFTMRPAFGGPPIPVGVDVQVESLDTISEADMFNQIDCESRFNMSVLIQYYLCFPGWYNRLYIHFTLRRHVFFFLLQTYFPATLMVMLSWVSFWIDRRAVPARVPLGITTVLTMSTIITGVNASMPRVSYIKAVDIYLWVSFVFVFLSVIEYAAVNYLTTVQERRGRKLRNQLPCTCGIANPEEDMMMTTCYIDWDPSAAGTYGMPENGARQERILALLTLADSQRRSRVKTSRGYVNVWIDTHAIDKYSRVIFPAAYTLFNIIYWSIYS